MMEKGAEATPLTHVIIAALNEEHGIGLTIAEMQAHINCSVLVVDGNSTDRTVEVAKNLGAEIAFQNGKGKGDALAKAIECSNLDVDYIVITDADFTYPAEHIPQMIAILQENPRVGMVCGNRFTENLDTKALHTVFHLGNRLIAFTHSFLNGVQMKDPLTGLRVVRAEILKDWVVKSKGFDIEVELNHLVERKGYQIVEVPIGYRERVGEKKLKVKHGMDILKRIMLETTQ
ncbi:MAG: glycosyltransferase family 2 protein [Candidatus Bathyarchaeia archaeon]|jgi:dolichol-phosphate mannosyltransferase